MYTPKHLKKWELPKYYFGEEWPEYYVFLGRTRDSDNLENSNFEECLEFIGGESDTVKIVTENHWAVGWVQWIAIHESDLAALEMADHVKDKLSDYPIWDDDDYSRREWDDFMGNCEQAVKDYARDHDLEWDSDYLEKVTTQVTRESNESNADTWPSESDIEEAIESLKSQD